MSLSLRNVSVVFSRKPFLPWQATHHTHALRRVSCTIAPNETFVLLGASGCGKTTLLSALAGFVPLAEGAIYKDDVTLKDVACHARGMVLLSQSIPLVPTMRVRDNIALHGDIHGFRGRPRDEVVRETSAIVGIEHLLEKYPDEISGGERQRVALASRVLVPDSKIVLMDEPLSSLDAQRQKQLRALLGSLFKAHNRTVVYVTHNQEEARVLADRIAVMRDGHIEQIGTYEQLYDKPETVFVAEFIGDMNTLSCGMLVGPFRNATTLCIRPHHVLVSDTPDTPGSRQATVQSRECCGTHDALTFVMADGAQLVAHAARGAMAHTTCYVSLPEEHRHFFDCTGKRVEARRT